MIKKVESGYKVDIRPKGRSGPRFRKLFPTLSDAKAYENYIIAENPPNEPWKPVKDSRTLSQLIDIWHRTHGQQLKSGNQRYSYLLSLCDLMDNPQADKLTAKDFSRVREKRLKSGSSANTVNHDLAYIKAMFSELMRLGEWKGDNPFSKIRRIKVDEAELSYLEKDQITELLNKLDEHPKSHARIIARVCLATGARWGEAATLKASQVKNGKVHFTGTKSGKNRSVPISKELETLVSNHLPMVDGYSTFKRTIASLDLELPKGQLSHVLRHTFASWFMINGGNIITLQRVLGHGSLQMTMRYAHLSPDHLTEVLDKNPLVI